MDEQGVFTYCADETKAGQRLDIFLSLLNAELSRSYILRLIKSGNVLVCGKLKKPGYRVKSGDSITFNFPKEQPSQFLPEPINLDIIFEDQFIIVVNKPPGLVVHPAPGHLSGTLVNAVLYHCPDLKGIGGEIRPGIVHRLDKDTSGVIIVAKDAATHQDLAKQFKKRTVQKEYIALVHGQMESDSGKISLPIGRHEVDRKKMSTKSPKSRDAETLWKIIKRFTGVSLVGINLKTGRTHQIRIHFFAVGHAVVGDPVYSGKNSLKSCSKEVSDILLRAKRQMLHAKRLTITHPVSKETMTFESALPRDMEDILKSLDEIDKVVS
jgi:23S rRNA pseudouridine1911/1915/1917 synthase